MIGKSTLFQQANGDPVKGYMLLKSNGGNVPSAWVERYTTSRRNKQSGVANALKVGLKGYATLLEWEEAYKEAELARVCRSVALATEHR